MADVMAPNGNGAKRGCALGNVFEDRQIVIEIDRFPAVVMHWAWAICVRPWHDAIAQMTLEAHGASI